MTERRSHGHHHGHDRGTAHDHGHTHGVVDPMITASDRGIWAIKWSFIGLAGTAAIQFVVAMLSGSIGLLADTIHNIGDAATAVPLGIAFLLSRWKPSKRFTFGYGRVEDLAGMAVVLTILISALVAGYETIDRFLHPRDVSHLWAVIGASIIGFAGNEGVAVFRLRVGREIGSAALIADGQHARIDGWTSLAVLLGAVGVSLGFPLADPIVGAVITIAILGIVWQSMTAVFLRVLDGVEPKYLDEIRHAAMHVPQVHDVTDVRARWLGHRLHAEVNITVPSDLTVAEGHGIAAEVRHQLLHHLKYLSLTVIHVDPDERSGERFHAIEAHSHDSLPAHSHAA
jgi:cation diffusion facilitator family transporter